MTSSISSPERLDALRAQYPLLGFALYALEPGRPVTLEVYAPDGRIFRFDAATAAGALLKAFPADPPALVSAPIEPDAKVDLFS